ncbi:MAG: DUF2147 domain-containing protein [Schleiferiaceae bacterium]|nr:DUF2147 domain-containing protein [Schleiferiaceae bacterium]MDR9443152.1 DUF2147 domain-containing protein [Schleiferiaceae bacterium]
MRTKMKWPLLGLALFLGTLSWGQADGIVGIWKTEEGKSKVKIYQKGEAYYGKLVWLRDSLEDNGDINRDDNNPEPKLRDRPLQGLQIIKDLRWDASDEEWDDGEIYDPESGNTYSVYAYLKEPNTLFIKGYLGVSLLGRSTLWKRVR